MYGEDLLNSYYADVATSYAMNMEPQAVYALGIVSTVFRILFVLICVAIPSIIGLWKIFTKAGEKGWKSLIPIYGTVVLFRIAGLSPLLMLGYLASVIPVVGTLISLGITICLYYNLAKAFGKGSGFTVGLVLLSLIFIPILGLGKSEYQLNKNATETIEN